MKFFLLVLLVILSGNSFATSAKAIKNNHNTIIIADAYATINASAQTNNNKDSKPKYVKIDSNGNLVEQETLYKPSLSELLVIMIILFAIVVVMFFTAVLTKTSRTEKTEERQESQKVQVGELTKINTLVEKVRKDSQQIDTYLNNMNSDPLYGLTPDGKKQLDDLLKTLTDNNLELSQTEQTDIEDELSEMLGENAKVINTNFETSDISSNDAKIYLNEGAVLQKSKKYDEAIEKFMMTVAIDPRNAEAYNRWGLVLDELGKHEEAIEKYKMAIEIDPKDVFPRCNISSSLHKAGRLREAEKADKIAKGMLLGEL